MLLRYDENGGFWATPGGSLEPGETPRQAVIRELREELGVRHVDLGPHLATRTKDHQVAGRDVRQAERYYLARVRPENVDPQSAANPSTSRSGAGGPWRNSPPPARLSTRPNSPNCSGASSPPGRRSASHAEVTSQPELSGRRPGRKARDEVTSRGRRRP